VEPKASQQRAQRIRDDVRVTAVVVTRHTGQRLEMCLRSIFAEPWIDEVVIVDNGNPAPVSSALRALQADRMDVKLAPIKRGASLAAAANLGAQKATGRWLLFIDPTVVVQRGAVERMVLVGHHARSPWIVGGRLTDSDGREQPAARAGALTSWLAASLALGLKGQPPLKIEEAGVALDRHRNAPQGLAPGSSDGQPVPVGSVSASFMLIPRADFEALAGFDEGYVSDGQDLDICRRVGEAGGAVLHVPAASAVRFSPPRRAQAGRREGQGLSRFAAKAAKTPAQRLFALFAPPVIGLLLVVRGLRRGKKPVEN
jgi:GT2 family glycosyltransferase